MTRHDRDPLSPRKVAIALQYDTRSAAPRVVAKGYGQTAESIIALAKDAGVYVHDAPALVNLLMQVDLDSQIPPQLYVAVAELLVWLHRLEDTSDIAPAAEHHGQASTGAK